MVFVSSLSARPENKLSPKPKANKNPTASTATIMPIISPRLEVIALGSNLAPRMPAVGSRIKLYRMKAR